jgi:hypothetical protein
MTLKNTNAAPTVERRSGVANRTGSQRSENYHEVSGAATTARAEPSLDGRSAHADLESRPAVTVPSIESHIRVTRSTSVRVR